MNQKKIERRISLLDWLIILAALVMLAVVYIPAEIWKDEVKDRRESRHRMTVISEAQEFFKELTGSYTTNGLELFALVEAAMDSLIADSLFTDEKIINLNGKKYPVTIKRGFEVRVDTTFSSPRLLERSFLDTVYTAEFRDRETGSIITESFKARYLAQRQADTNFVQIVSTEVEEISEEYTDYSLNKFHLIPELLNCPLTEKPYVMEIDETDPDYPVFTVRSPVPEGYTERRFYIFKYEAGDHGHIADGEPTWAERV